MPLVSVVVPTYQERDNIETLVKRLGQTLSGRDYEIVIVDDNSPDGTAAVAMTLAREYPIRVIQREGRLGLGSAILEGFKNAKGEIMGVIDADLQHPPELVIALVQALEEGNDIAIASRYASGGGVENWTAMRKVVSKGATLLARPLTKVRDPMSGCFFLRQEVIQTGTFTSIGYKILLEILAVATYKNVKEIPYTFGSRERGKSKLGLIEYGRYLKLLYHLYLAKLKLGSKATRESEASLVSVIVPTLNEESYIGDLLDSLKAQDSPHFEVIIVDGGSKDGTAEIARAYGARVFVEPGMREFPSRNLGAQLAQGEILLFTGADAIFPSNLIGKISQQFEESKLLALGGSGIPYHVGLHWKIEWTLYLLARYLFAKLPKPLKAFSTSTNLTAVRKSAFVEVGGFNPNDLNADGMLGRKLCVKGKVKYSLSVHASIAPRRLKQMGFIGFNLRLLFVLENFFPFLSGTAFIRNIKAKSSAVYREMRTEGK